MASDLEISDKVSQHFFWKFFIELENPGTARMLWLLSNSGWILLHLLYETQGQISSPRESTQFS